MGDLTRTSAIYFFLFSCVSCSQPTSESMKPMITYRGQEIPISKAYESYEDYKDDPKNIPREQIDRIEQLLLAAPASPLSFDGRIRPSNNRDSVSGIRPFPICHAAEGWDIRIFGAD